MKHYKKILLAVTASLMMASCADNDIFDYQVDRPGSLDVWEYLNQYDALKTYVNRSENPDFKLGAGASLSDYISRGVGYRLLNANFDEITMGWEMKHGAIVQGDGSLALDNMKKLLQIAKESGMSVYGHTLCWHANQNASYLNGLIAPIKGEPRWDVIMEQNFETDDESNYQYNNNAIMSFTADGEGAYGTGRALKITNSENRPNDWDCQLYLKFSPKTVAGDIYELSMDVRADAPATFSDQAQREPMQYKHWVFFGPVSATTQWQTITRQVTISQDQAECGAIAFNLGLTGTNYYFDNITLKKYDDGTGGGSSLDPSIINNGDFEAGNTDGWIGWGNDSSRGLSASGEGYEDTGYALKMTNPTAVSGYMAQTAYDFATPLTKDSDYKVKFNVKGTIAASITAGIQSTSNYSANSFGSFNITTDWTEVELETTITESDRNRFLFDIGTYAGTIYIDNISLCRVNPEGGNERPDEEKRELIDKALETFIAGMMEACVGSVKAWDVVNEPMDDWPDPSKLKTGIGKDNLSADEFYWQDYLGEYYAARAIELARHYHEKSGGNPNELILFINDYGLESPDQRKCNGLIAYIDKIEKDKGVKVDGIGTQMHVTCNETSMQGIRDMFTNMAATGKLVKVSELDMGYRIPGTTENVKTSDLTREQAEEMGVFYEEIVKAYFELIPANQRYGITHWSPLDSPESSSWRGGEPIGLWTLGYNRKPAYGGFANGLAGKTIATDTSK